MSLSKTYDQLIFHFVALIALIISNAITRYYVQKIVTKLDEDTISPSDYTVIFKHIPIKKFVASEFLDYVKDYNPVKMNITYKIHDYIKSVRELEEWKMKKKFLDFFRELRKEEEESKGQLTEEKKAEIKWSYPPPSGFCCFKSNPPNLLTRTRKIPKIGCDRREDHRI